MSIDPVTSVITYTPAAGEVGLVTMTFQASNVAGSATQTVQFQVAPAGASPTITWPAPADVPFGTWINDTQLDAVAKDPGTGLPVAGTYNYTPAFGTELLATGLQTLSVTFTPSNLSAYSPVTASTTINVVPATPTIPLGGPFTYSGTPQPAATVALGVDGFTPVAGTLTVTYNGSTTVPTDAGSYDVVASFVSSDSNYTDTTVYSTLLIAPAPVAIAISGGPFNYDGAPHAATATTAGVDGVTPVSGGITLSYNGSPTIPTNAGEYLVEADFVSTDPNYADTSAFGSLVINGPPSNVAAVKLFYDDSKFNKNIEGAAGGTTDDKAIDPTKAAYLPGTGTAGFASISGFTNGINGIMVDLTPGGAHNSLTADDFTFRVGLNNAPTTWGAAPAPSTLAVRSGAGTGGADRVELTWTDGWISEE